MLSSSSSLPVAFCFAGQGSQYFHMAAAFLKTYPVFRQWMDIGDRIVQNAQGFSVLDIIYSDEHGISDPFDRLEHSHPALFITQFAVAKLLQNQGVRPDLLLGASLGEFVAMSVSGMLPFETALRAVACQPALFEKSAPKGALIGTLASASVRSQSKILAESTEIAGKNGASHCVLACRNADLETVLGELRRLDISFQTLPVPFAFHSRWIEPAKQDFLNTVSGLHFETPFWPVWSSCLCRDVQQADGRHLWDIVRQPMQLQATLHAIEARGGARYIDLSPTGTLAAVFRQELSEKSASEVVPLMSPYGGDLKRIEALFPASP
ncbi:acyltransferase domain-containing protein [Roseibium album]|uniref:acyltransferase domain-containing protein n=1 Tax=Roseibium album TaxID=311410 RepID=UPI00391C50BC